MRKKSGFTLIELIVTISVLGIVLGFAIPFLHTFVSNYRLKSAVSNLRGDIQKTRSLARANRLAYTLDFIGTDQYRIVDANSNVVMSRTLDRDVTRTTGDDVTFDSIGRTNATTIRLVNSKGDQYNLRITITGQIEVS